MVFIDGDHTFKAVIKDLLSWKPKCRKLFCGHDYDFDEVKEALAVYGLPVEGGPGSIWYTEIIE
jgi:hypothetical protein